MQLLKIEKYPYLTYSKDDSSKEIFRHDVSNYKRTDLAKRKD